MLRHFQGAVSQQLLEHECIPATIYKIFPGEGMAIQMGAVLLDSAGVGLSDIGSAQLQSH